MWPLLTLQTQHSHRATGVWAGKASKTTMHFCEGNICFLSGRGGGGGGGGGGAGPRHAPTFSYPATLHDGLFWEAQVGTRDTKLTKHSLSLWWGQLVPWQCWPRMPLTRHTSWQSPKERHRLCAPFGRRRERSVTPLRDGGPASDYGTRNKIRSAVMDSSPDRGVSLAPAQCMLGKDLTHLLSLYRDK